MIIPRFLTRALRLRGGYVYTLYLITAAHCFWNDISKNQPASMYAVAIGKIYRPWNTKQDTNAQKSDVCYSFADESIEEEQGVKFLMSIDKRRYLQTK